MRKIVVSFLSLLLVLQTMAQTSSTNTNEKPPREPFRLRLQAPIKTWDEAIPLGNGLMGGLLWGEGGNLKLSLDRGDLWDLRTSDMIRREDWNYETLKRLQAEVNQAESVRMFDSLSQKPAYPTKIPCGRLELNIENFQANEFALDLQKAVGNVGSQGNANIETFFSAVNSVAMIRVKNAKADYKIIRPESLAKLGYAEAVSGNDGQMKWMVQEAALGLKYVIAVGENREGGQTIFAVAVASTNDGANPLQIAQNRVKTAHKKGYEGELKPHLAWWKNFWQTSSVKIPNDALQFHYNLVKYFYGAASRPNSPPMPLQGVWTADSDNLPPWKGDYHNDLNTQMSYIAYQTAGLFESGESFTNFNWNLLPKYRQFAQKFYKTKGAIVPGVTSLDGTPIGGWRQYSYSPTAGLWVGHSFYQHWRFTKDPRFLAERAYPWLTELGEGVSGLLKENANGKLKLPLSSSPEIYDNTMKAWLPPNSNYDQSLMQWTFETLAEMADELGKKSEAQKWKTLRGKLEDLDVDNTDSLTFAKGLPYNVSHRHFSHTLAIYPLGTLDIEGSERERRIVKESIKTINKYGTQSWVGYSFSWMACNLARIGEADLALKYLKDYERAFILRNGFHVNGDQTKSGLSRFTYRPFTLEGNFLAMQAVQEMILQSWSDVVRVFPAVPNEWQNVEFTNLRAEGGFKVSAKRQNGKTVNVQIEATADGILKLRDNFGGQLRWNRRNITKKGENFEIRLKKGETLTGVLQN